jgi:hypothetical protein
MAGLWTDFLADKFPIWQHWEFSFRDLQGMPKVLEHTVTRATFGETKISMNFDDTSV